MKDIIIFGIGKISEVISYYFNQGNDYNIVAYTVDNQFVIENSFLKKPIVPFEELQKKYDPSKFGIFIAVGYHNLNRLRERKLNEAKLKGYKAVSCIDTGSISADLKYGENCFIMPGANIHPCVQLGNNVFVWSGAMIGHHSRIGNHNWFTSCANVGGNVKMEDNCFMAMNATISHSVEIGSKVFLGANALVTKNIKEGQVVIAQNDKPIKLNSEQFLRMSAFTNL